MRTCFIIPAYEPNHNLIILLQKLIEESEDPIFVVDDGSRQKSIFKDPLFSDKRIILLIHDQNLGKGAALKTAFNHMLVYYPHITACITLDADGQHSIEDVMKLSLLNERKNHLVLGVRNFNFKDKNVPLKSRLGNLLTRCIWKFITGKMITDTQTGLRRIPTSLMRECLHIAANRYEFEMEMLLAAQNVGITISEVPINIIYIDHNEGSHFNPVFDSLKIYFVIFRFCLSSLFSYVIDCTLFVTFVFALSFSTSVAFILARLITGYVNYHVNKNIVFNFKKTQKSAVLKYISILMLNSYLGFFFIDYIEIYASNAFYSKLIVEFILFFFNFFLQKEWVFKKQGDLK